MIYAIPTDTCYGFAANLFDEAGFRSIYELKGRDDKKPLSIVVNDYDEVSRFIDITDSQLDFLKKYPHPFTVLGKRKDDLDIPDFLDENYKNLAIRVASRCLDEKIRNYLEFPMFLTSANKSGEEEIHDSLILKHRFGHHEKLEIFEGNSKGKPASDLFSFIGKGLNLKYFRKNHTSCKNNVLC